MIGEELREKQRYSKFLAVGFFEKELTKEDDFKIEFSKTDLPDEPGIYAVVASLQLKHLSMKIGDKLLADFIQPWMNLQSLDPTKKS